jgi:predicted aminopeptidase
MGPIGVVLHLFKHVVLGAVALVVVVGGIAFVASPDVRYVARAAAAEGGILLRARPIANVIADSGTDPATRAKLELVLAARDFAADSLHLAAKRTYTTYSRLAHDTLVFVVSASRSDRLEEHTWWFPVVGRVPYKGFFSLNGARAEARRLEAQGLDTFLRTSDAFSTLGWFNDPLLSTVVREDSADLAATVIHEILHNTIWVPGHVPFNESLADFVGYRGAEAFFRSRGDTVNAGRASARWADEIRLAAFYDTLAARLDTLYGSGTAGPALDSARARIFAAARDDLAGGLSRTLATVDGRWLARQPLNNAVVIAERLYRTRLEVFEHLLAQQGGALVPAIAAVKREVAGRADPWAALGAGPGS